MNYQSPTVGQEAIRLAEHLRLNHTSKENAVTTKHLKPLFGSGVIIRQLVHELRLGGYPICSGNVGYYYAKDPHELDHTLDYLNSHARNVLEAYEGLKKARQIMEVQQIADPSRPKQITLFDMLEEFENGL